MKKAILITFIFCIAGLINTSYGFSTDSTKYAMTCTDNGAIEINSPDIIEPANAYKVDIKAKNIAQNSTFNIPGTWTAGKFTSKEAIINETGEHVIIISFQDQDDKVEMTVDCPGLIFSCKLFSIDISRCYMYDNTFHAIFDAKNLGKHNWDLNTNLTYIASDDKGKSTELDPTSKLEHIKISEIGNEKYKLEWTTERNIELFHIKAPICKTTTSKICTEPQECTKDDDCQNFEYCNNYCQKLNCNDNEYISDHTCILPCTTNRDCDDSLACTTDRCKNSICTHEPLRCISEDTCTTGECKEPVGCTYKIDKDCKEIEQEATRTLSSQTKDTESGEPQKTESECTTTVTFLLVIIIILVFHIIHTTKKPKPIKKRKTK